MNKHNAMSQHEPKIDQQGKSPSVLLLVTRFVQAKWMEQTFLFVAELLTHYGVTLTKGSPIELFISAKEDDTRKQVVSIG